MSHGSHAEPTAAAAHAATDAADIRQTLCDFQDDVAAVFKRAGLSQFAPQRAADVGHAVACSRLSTAIESALQSLAAQLAARTSEASQLLASNAALSEQLRQQAALVRAASNSDTAPLYLWPSADALGLARTQYTQLLESHVDLQSRHQDILAELAATQKEKDRLAARVTHLENRLFSKQPAAAEPTPRTASSASPASLLRRAPLPPPATTAQHKPATEPDTFNDIQLSGRATKSGRTRSAATAPSSASTAAICQEVVRLQDAAKHKLEEIKGLRLAALCAAYIWRARLIQAQAEAEASFRSQPIKCQRRVAALQRWRQFQVQKWLRKIHHVEMLRQQWRMYDPARQHDQEKKTQQEASYLRLCRNYWATDAECASSSKSAQQPPWTTPSASTEIVTPRFLALQAERVHQPARLAALSRPTTALFAGPDKRGAGTAAMDGALLASLGRG